MAKNKEYYVVMETYKVIKAKNEDEAIEKFNDTSEIDYQCIRAKVNEIGEEFGEEYTISDNE